MMDVGYILLVSICVLQIAWPAPAVGLKLSLTNISSKSSPSSTNSTKSSVSPFQPKISTDIDTPELKSNLGRPANRFLQTTSAPALSPNVIGDVKESELISNDENTFNRFSPIQLSSPRALSPNVFVGDVKETESRSKVGNTFINNVNKLPQTPVSSSFASSANAISDTQDSWPVENTMNTNFNRLSPKSSSRSSALPTNVFIGDVKETGYLSKLGNKFINNCNNYPQTPSSPWAASSPNVFSSNVKEIESMTNIGNSLTTNINRLLPFLSTPAPSANLLNNHVKETKDLLLQPDQSDNLKPNNALSMIQSSLNTQYSNPSSAVVESRITNEPYVSPKISMFNNYVPNISNIGPEQMNNAGNNDLLSNRLNPNCMSYSNKKLLNTDNNNIIDESQVFLDSSGSQPINNHVNNLEVSNGKQNTDHLNNIVLDLQNSKMLGVIGQFQKNVDSFQSNILSNSQNSQAPVSLNIMSNTFTNNQQPDLSLIKNNIGSGSVLPYNLANNITPETKSESHLSRTNPLKSITANTQTNLANRIPATNADLISNFNNNIFLQQPNSNVYDKSIGNSDILDNNPRLNSLSLNGLQKIEFQESLPPQNLLPPNVPIMNTVLGQNNVCVNNQNVLPNDFYVNNENIQKSILVNNNENKENSCVELTSKYPNLNNIPTAEYGASVFPNIFQNTPHLPELNKVNRFSQPVPNTPYIPDNTTIPWNTNIVTPNILQPNTFISPPQQVFPPNNIQPCSFQLLNPSVESQSTQLLPESLNINSNLDLTTHSENLKNQNSISNIASMIPNPLLTFPQNNNAKIFNLATLMGSQAQMPINNNLEINTSYFNSNCDKYSPFTPHDIYNLKYTDASFNKKSSIDTISDEKSCENNSTESKENVLTTSYLIPKISDLPNVLASNYVTLPQATSLLNISPSNLVVPQIENLIPTNDITKSIIDLGNDVARQWIDNLLVNTNSVYAPINPVPISYSLPNKDENVTPSMESLPNIVETQSLPIVPPPEVTITSPDKENIEVDQSNQFTPSFLSTDVVQEDEPQGLFPPRFHPIHVPMYSPSVLPTPTINYPVFPPYMSTPPINFPPVPPLFSPVPSIIEAPVFKLNSGGQDSRKWIELLLLASLLNNDCNDRGPLETIIALMLAT